MVAPTSGATKKRRSKRAASRCDSSQTWLEAMVDADVLVARQRSNRQPLCRYGKRLSASRESRVVNLHTFNFQYPLNGAR
jgi:hypothetical protein